VRDTSPVSFCAALVLLAVASAPALSQSVKAGEQTPKSRVIVLPLVTSDSSAAERARLATALVGAAQWLNGLPNAHVSIDASALSRPGNPTGSSVSRGSTSPLELQAILSGSADSTAIVIDLKRSADDSNPVTFPVLSHFGTQIDVEIAQIIRYELSVVRGLPQPGEQPPEYFATVDSSMLSSADLPYDVPLRPVSVAVLPDSHIVVGTTLVADELDGYLREVGKPGKELYDSRNLPYAYQVASSPAGTIVAEGVNSGSAYLLYPGIATPTVVRTGIETPSAMTMLDDGSLVVVDAMRHRAYRFDGGKRRQIDIFPGKDSYVTAISSGPDNTIWVWDPIEGRAHLYTGDGTKIGAFIPLLSYESRRSIRLIHVLADGSVILVGPAGIWKVDANGTPLWYLDQMPAPAQGGFTYISNVAVDESRSLIYLADQVAGTVTVLCDVADAARKNSSDPFRDTLLALNRKIAVRPDNADFLQEKARIFEKVGSFAVARAIYRQILDADPQNQMAQEAYNAADTQVLTQGARQAAERAVRVLTTIGKENARTSYQTAVKLYENAIARSKVASPLRVELDRLKQRFQEGVPSPPPIVVANRKLEPLFPALLRYYQAHSAWTFTLTNSGSVPLSGVTVSVSMRYLDFPATSAPGETILPGATIQVPLSFSLSPTVLSLEEDMPVQVEYTVAATEGSGNSAIRTSLTGTATTTIHRVSAITWDKTAKFASFITPNDDVISTFAVSAGLHQSFDPKWQIPARIRRAAAIVDALGALGMSYTEDPTAPISKVLGNPEYIDNVRFPRVTIRLHTGDCDDTTALLASCLEADGIPTAILTSPGHIFLAFDTGIPEEYKWMYSTSKTEAIGHGGTLWLPIETTIMAKGFAEAWASASDLVREYQDTKQFEFLPTATQQETYPAIPLPQSSVRIIPPAEANLAALTESSDKLIGKLLLVDVTENLTRAAAADGSHGAPVYNRIGIVNAQFDQLAAASAAFEKAVQLDAAYFAAYINLGQAYLLDGHIAEAQSVALRAASVRPDSPALLLLRSRIASATGNVAQAKQLISDAKSRSSGDLAAALGAIDAQKGAPATAERASNESSAAQDAPIWIMTP